MHEAGAVIGAIEKATGDWPPGAVGGQLELEIRDATRAEASAVAFYTAAILTDLGFTTTSFTVVTDQVDCAFCGRPAKEASPSDPQCNGCGAPLPQVPGPAVVCRQVAPCA